MAGASGIEYVDDFDTCPDGGTDCREGGFLSNYKIPPTPPPIPDTGEEQSLYILVDEQSLVRVRVNYCPDSGLLRILCQKSSPETSGDDSLTVVKGNGKEGRRSLQNSIQFILSKAVKLLKEEEKLCIDFNEVREVRKIGKETSVKVVNTNQAASRSVEKKIRKYWILHGLGFKLAHVEIWALSKAGEKVMDSLWDWRQYFMSLPYSFHIRALAQRHFNEFLQGGEETKLMGNSGIFRISASECKKICINLGYGSCLTEMGNEAGTDKFSTGFHEFSKNGVMSFDGFYKLFRKWLNEKNEAIIRYSFGTYDPGRPIRFNNVSLTVHPNKNGDDNRECITGSGVSEEDLVDYLFSQENSIFDLKCYKVYQNMEESLWKYWISTSHNTYLRGHQLIGPSTAEAYIRCFSLGSRCVELDCWDGRKGKPIIKHGWTLTTKISFVSVIEAINEHGFKHTDYPLILSIENHCSEKQQDYMADKLIGIFGERLYRADDNTELVDSPENLRGKVLIKCKMGKSTEEPDPDFTYEKKNVFLFDSESKSWESYIMGLTRKDLRFVKLPKIQRMPSDSRDWESCSDLHELEKWYHGGISGTVAQDLVKKYKKENCFLIRKSSKQGEYTLVLLAKEKNKSLKNFDTLVPKNFPIKKDGQGKFYLQHHHCDRFDSIFSFVTYYQEHELGTEKSPIGKLGEPVPVVRSQDYSEETWYNANITREEAEKVFRKQSEYAGYFLVRPSASKPGSFVVSFQCKEYLNRTVSQDDEIIAVEATYVKHCRIAYRGIHFVVADKRFDNLADLVRYYQSYPFYKWNKLGPPLSVEDCDRILGETDDTNLTNPEEAGGSYAYTYDGKSLTLDVRAIRNYSQPDDAEALQFSVGDIIRNVRPDDDRDGGWFIGDCNGRIQKRFPTTHVREVEEGGETREVQAGGQRKDRIPLNRPRIKKMSNPPSPNDLNGGSDSQLKEAPSYCIQLRGSDIRIGVLDRSEAVAWKRAIQRVRGRERRPQFIKEAVKGLKKKIHGLMASKKTLGKLEKLVYLPGGSVSTDEESQEKPGSSRKAPERMSQKRVASVKSSTVERAERDSRIFNDKTYIWRSYPASMDSSNYNPAHLWNLGVQLVALNFQTADKWMGVNQGKFWDNGKCGYVLKPDYMTVEPGLGEPEFFKHACRISVTIIAARNLYRQGSKVSNPYVIVEIIGLSNDAAKRRIYFPEGNGLNPVCSTTLEFTIANPELAQIKFTVNDEDAFSDSYFVGQATYPIPCLRQGPRSIRLQTNFGEDLNTCSVLLVGYKKCGRAENAGKDDKEAAGSSRDSRNTV